MNTMMRCRGWQGKDYLATLIPYRLLLRNQIKSLVYKISKCCWPIGSMRKELQMFVEMVIVRVLWSKLTTETPLVSWISSTSMIHTPGLFTDLHLLSRSIKSIWEDQRVRSVRFLMDKVKESWQEVEVPMACSLITMSGLSISIVWTTIRNGKVMPMILELPSIILCSHPLASKVEWVPMKI